MSLSNPDVYIEGVALNIGWADARHNLSELIFETARGAIDDAGRGIDGIDSVVLAAHDLVDGRSLSSMVTGPAAGAYLRDEIRYGDDGAGAFAAAVTRIESGESTRTVVSAWGRASEHNVQAVSRILFDPFFGRPLGLEELHVSAMRAQAWRGRSPGYEDAQTGAAARLTAARRNPRALSSGGSRSHPSYPLTELDLPLWADVFVSVVLSGQKNGVRVAGVGMGSEPYWVGDRQLLKLPALRRAAQGALGEAGCGIEDIDVFEVDGMTLYDEALALEALGAAKPGEGIKALSRDARCNPSGGSAAGYCAPAMGLTRIVEAVLQLRGTAGANQVTGSRRALASGSSILAAQTQTVVVLEVA